MLDFKFILDENYVISEFVRLYGQNPIYASHASNNFFNYFSGSKKTIEQVNDLIKKNRSDYESIFNYVVQSPEYKTFYEEAVYYKEYLSSSWSNNKFRVNEFLKDNLGLKNLDILPNVYISSPKSRNGFTNQETDNIYFSHDAGVNNHNVLYDVTYLTHEAMHVALKYHPNSSIDQENVQHAIIELSIDNAMYSYLSSEDKSDMGHTYLKDVKNRIKDGWDSSFNSGSFNVENFVNKHINCVFNKDQLDIIEFKSKTEEEKSEYFIKFFTDCNGKNFWDKLRNICYLSVEHDDADYTFLNYTIKSLTNMYNATSKELEIGSLSFSFKSKIEIIVDGILPLYLEKIELCKPSDSKDRIEDVFDKVFSKMSKHDLGDLHFVNKSDAFNFKYLLYIPDKIESNTLIVEGNNTCFDSEIATYYDKSKYITESVSSTGLFNIFDSVKAPLMLCLIPITNIYEEKPTSEYYTQQLSRNTVLSFADKSMHMLDLQILNAINDAKRIVNKERSIELTNKSFLYGYSTSSKFASRLTFLHPESFCGTFAGGIGAAIPLPIDFYNNTKLIYPVGTYDYETVTGKKFNVESYKEVPQFYYMGDHEAERFNIVLNPTLHDKEVTNAYVSSQSANLYDRMNNLPKIFLELGYNNVETKIYNNAGHNPRVGYEDAVKFYKYACTKINNENLSSKVK